MFCLDLGKAKQGPPVLPTWKNVTNPQTLEDDEHSDFEASSLRGVYIQSAKSKLLFGKKFFWEVFKIKDVCLASSWCFLNIAETTSVTH